MRIKLTQLKEGQFGKVVDLQGGTQFRDQMKIEGIIEGRTLERIKTMKRGRRFWEQRVRVRILETKYEVELGLGQAEKIIVEIQEYVRVPKPQFAYKSQFAYT